MYFAWPYILEEMVLLVTYGTKYFPPELLDPIKTPFPDN